MRRRQANFPAGKTFEVWDEQRCSIPAATQHALRTLEWVDRHENMCVCGPSGTGKSHFCEALGQLAIDTGRTVAWFSIEELGALVRRHRADDSINKAIRRITRVDLIIVDDIGMLAVGEDAAEGFYRLVDACYEKRSLAVSSNLHPAGFDEIMPKTLATATGRPAPAPRPHLRHRRPIVPTRPSHRRQGGDAIAHLTNRGDLTTVHGDKPWPPVGTSPDRIRRDPHDR